MPRWTDKLTIYIPGEEIQKRRKALGLTQSQLAQILENHQPNIARWESGKAVVSKVMADYIRSVFERLEQELAENKQAA